MNEKLAALLPKPPEGLGWRIGVSGDGQQSSVTIRLTDLLTEKSYVVSREWEVPKAASPSGLAALVSQQAQEMLQAYERQQVLATFPGLYDGWETQTIEEEAA